MKLPRELGISTQITAITQQAMEGKRYNASFTDVSDVERHAKAVLNAVCDRMTPFAGPVNCQSSRPKGFKTAIISGGLDIFATSTKRRYQLDYAFRGQDL